MIFNHRIFYAVGLVCLVLGGSGLEPERAWAQKGDSTAAADLSVSARLVNLPVVVRDKKGALINNLTKDDFKLQVDGKPQVIRYFDRDANLPLTLGLLVDTSASQRSAIDDERSASEAFLDQMLKTEKDQTFVMQFSRQVELLGDLTSSKPKLRAALKEIDTTAPGGARDGSNDDDKSGGASGTSGSSGSSRGGGRRYAGGTTLYDAVFLAADELMSKQKGRKAIIILSDGVDRGSKESLTKALESAQRADTVIYAIYFKGEEPQQDWGRRGGGGGRYPGGGYPGGGYPGGGYPGRYPGGGYPGGGGGNGGGGGSGSHIDGKRVLKQMSEETGGRLFEVSKKETVAKIYDQIAEELRAQYRLGYTPDQTAAAEGYHQVDLSVTKKDLFVQTRDGYYGGK